MMAGRTSVFDNQFYLSATYPPPLDSDQVSLSAFQRASMAIMHVFIQCPRLAGLVRNAIMDPNDLNCLASAMSLLESLIRLNLPLHVAELLETTVTTVQTPTSPDMADIMPDSLAFESVQSMVLCTRYWMLQNLLCGLTETLHRHFPAETTMALLPDPQRMQAIDVDAALNLAKSLPWAESISRKLPLVPLRLHTPLQISIGPWHRIIRHFNATRTSAPDPAAELDPQSTIELSRAERMKAWLYHRCNLIHNEWNVSVIDEKPLLEALDTMTGEPIPDWLPVRVRFEAEDGEMVIKLDYENKTGSYSERYDLAEPPPKRSPNPFESEQRWQRESLGVQALPLRSAAASARSSTHASAEENERAKEEEEEEQSPHRLTDFIHTTGRNLCATSGWWPETPGTATLRMDSTRETSAFSGHEPPWRDGNIGNCHQQYNHPDGHPDTSLQVGLAIGLGMASRVGQASRDADQV